MAKVRNLLPRLFLALVVLAVVFNTRWTTTFLPPAGRAPPTQQLGLLASAGALASIFGAPPSALAGIDEAAGTLSDTMYPLMNKVDWQRHQPFVKWLGTAPEKWDGKKLNVAMDKLLVSGLAMDQSLVARSVQAHLKAIVDGRANPKDPLLAPAEDIKEVTVSIANMLASAGAKKVYDVYDSFKQVGLTDLNREQWKGVGKSDVIDSYKAFLAMAEEVRKASPDQA